MIGKVRLGLFVALLASIFGAAYAAEAPKEIKLGTLRSSISLSPRTRSTSWSPTQARF